MVDLHELNQMKNMLLGTWEAYDEEAAPAPGGSDAQFQALPRLKMPRRGLAIGHSVDPHTGRPCIELRATAAKGRRRKQALKVEAIARAQGFDAVLRFFRPPEVSPTRIDTLPIIKGRRKPLHIGASVAHERGFAGSLGAFVRLDDGGTGILSCVHVLAWPGSKPKAKVGDPIQQPGLPDLTPMSNRIAELTGQFALFEKSQKNNLDAAIARLDPKVDHLGNLLPDLDSVPYDLRGKPVGKPIDSAELVSGMRVAKIGRTTGYTEATLGALDFRNLEVGFGSMGNGQTFTFSEVHEVLWDAGKPFTDAGDSGALVLACDGMRPIGINFSARTGAKGAMVSYVVPWSRIRAIFGAKLL